jgi:hypothetical protein
VKRTSAFTASPTDEEGVGGDEGRGRSAVSLLDSLRWLVPAWYSICYYYVLQDPRPKTELAPGERRADTDRANNSSTTAYD